MQALLSEGMFIDEPRLAVCERALKVSRKLRYAGRMLKKISVPMIGRCTRAALHANVPHPTLPLQNRLTNKRRYRKAEPRIILNHHEKISKITNISKFLISLNRFRGFLQEVPNGLL